MSSREARTRVVISNNLDTELAESASAAVALPQVDQVVHGHHTQCTLPIPLRQIQPLLLAL